jgi:dynein heavy chain 1
VDNIDGEWGAFNEIIKRKNSSIQTQVATLQMKIVAEDKLIETRSSEYIGEWERGKPVEGGTNPKDALQRIALFESRFLRLKEDRDNVAKAKDALELEEGSTTSATSAALADKLSVGWEELTDLKGVWQELSKVWEQIEEMKDQPWLSVQPRKLRQQIDQLLTQLKDLPSRLRQYAGEQQFIPILLSSNLSMSYVCPCE